MKTLIVEDDFACRNLLLRFLSCGEPCDVAVNGREAIGTFVRAHEAGDPYDLICLDISMPEMDGHEVLKKIRSFEAAKGLLSLDRVKIIMTTAHWDAENVMPAFKEECDAYLPKPIDKAKLDELLSSLTSERA